MTSHAFMFRRRKKPSPWQAGERDSKVHEINDTTSYEIEKEERSVPTLPIYSPLGIFSHVVVCVGWLLYLGLRFQTCLRASTSASPMQWGLWLLFICEVILAGPEFFQVLEVSLLFTPRKSPASRPIYRLNGDEAPSVHVFITYARPCRWITSLAC